MDTGSTDGVSMHSLIRLVAASILALTLPGCELAADVVRAGVWLIVVLVIIVVAFIVWLITRRLR